VETVASEILDCAVFPFPRHTDDLRSYMREPWRSKRYPSPFRGHYPTPSGVPPFGEFRPDARSTNGDLAGSDPDLVWRHLSDWGIGRAILLPLTRGLMPELDFGTAICAATNDWLADIWLSKGKPAGRFLGSIRVNPGDPEAAALEIERWAGHPGMVQIAVPLQVHRPYGQRNYSIIWETAVKYGLPVAVHSDGGMGIEYPPTDIGYPTYHIEFSSLNPLNCLWHLLSLIAEGVFERLPDLKFVFADGGHDFLMPITWKADSIWAPFQTETPWIARPPSDYVSGHVRFCTSRLEGPLEDESAMAEWLPMSQGSQLLMFGSHYPFWNSMAPRDVVPQLTGDDRQRVLCRNAADFYHKLDSGTH
jgi:uncharacterized protein